MVYILVLCQLLRLWRVLRIMGSLETLFWLPPRRFAWYAAACTWHASQYWPEYSWARAAAFRRKLAYCSAGSPWTSTFTAALE